MKFKRYEWNILFKVALMFITTSAAAFLLVKEWYAYLILIAPVIIYQLIDFFRFHKKAQEEVEQFVESVHYRDFSRYFNVKQAPLELQPLRQGFNEINTTFKVISREKETQFQYLQKILELVDTGILSYQIETGEIAWMNEALKKMLQVPYLKTIHSLQKRDPELHEHIQKLRPGEHIIANAHLEKNTYKILLTATAFQTEGQVFKLVAFQNIDEALDETEAKAWQKLLSVMTHEIMNSVAPISSLAETLKNRLQESSQELSITNGTLEDLELGIETIRRRSEGLLKFAQTYRNLNKIISPNLKKIHARELFANLHQLMLPTLEQKNIELEVILKDTDITFEADTTLVEQMLINLMVNAIEAVKDVESPKIFLSAYYSSNNNKTVIKVADNGPGIPEELIDKIFIPFFSTKKNGSGIGLSLCKQIMLLHKGNIQVQSKANEGTAFSLQF
jgi:two-component system nitrogen regulation sensor histidine kinase NtrY